MSMLFKLRVVKIVLLAFVLTGNIAYSQKSLSDKLPTDPKVRIGKLSNGLTYYIRQNKKPEQKVELRLVVNAGSILEDKDQQGLAHFLEHMAFNGTKNFKKNEILSFLQSIGVAFGNDLNAYTSFDETVYMLPIPLDKPSNLDNGFKILSDWAHNITNNLADVDAERGVVLEESRLGKGADDRMTRKMLPKLFAGSLYAERLPIGSDSIIQHHKVESLKRFYRDWYRPDLMAVMVVGDLDPVKAEQMIRKYFSSLTNPPKPRARTYTDVPAYAANEAMIVTDKEATDYVIQLYYSAQKAKPTTTLSGYREDIIRRIFSTLLNQRLRELTQKENPPFVFAGADYATFIRNHESFYAQIASGTNDPLVAISAFVSELEKVKRFGFTAAELDRVKKDLLSNFENAYKERNKTESVEYVSEYIRNFLQQEPIPGIEKEYEYYKQLLPQITIAEVNAFADFLKKNPNKFIALTGPEGSTVPLPTSEQILAKISEVEKMQVTAHEEKALASSLLSTTPTAGRILSLTKNSALGTTNLKLSNGVTVTLKKTDFKNDEVVMSSVRPGGFNAYGANDRYSAENATSVVGAMGYGSFSPTDLKKVLAGKTASLSTYINNISEGVNGNSSVKDLETLFQLIYLYHTEPRMDTSLFRSFVQKSKAQLAFMRANPQVAFIDTLAAALYQNNPLAPTMIPRPENYEKINLDRSYQIYKEKFGDVNGMHFTFVGSFNVDSIKQLIQKYIAGLPATTKQSVAVDKGVKMKPGNNKLEFFKGTEPKSLIISIYHGTQPYSAQLELKAQAIAEILNLRILEELREKIAGIYTGLIQAQVHKVPVPRYAFILQLPSGPEKVDTLLYAMGKEIEKLKTVGPALSDLNKVKQQWRENYKESIKENNTWLSELQSSVFPGKDISYFTNITKYLDALTVNDIKEAAKLLLSGDNVFTAILRPAKK